MCKLGLRGFSGPFDWCYSDFVSVIKQIENRFDDFMLKENLEVLEGNPKIFIDRKYGFYFNHEIKQDFELEYINI